MLKYTWKRRHTMLEDVARKYYKMGYNCAESMIRAGNEYYNLGLHDKDMNVMAPFGSGMQVGDVCGALTGACCVIGAKYVETKAHDFQGIKKLTPKLIRAFQQELGSRLCAQIKPKHYTKEFHCQDTVGLAASVLEKVIIDWEKEN